MTEVQKLKVILISYVWPEPTSSAAGLRDMNLIDSILKAGWSLVVASPCQENSFAEKLRERGIRTAQVRANDPTFDSWITEESPDLVIFDRFVIEEQFGWRVLERVPDATRVLDTQDLHFLRRKRAKLISAGFSLDDCQKRDQEFDEEDAFRELASVQRCDGVLVVSSYERDLLLKGFAVSPERVFLSRFQYPAPRKAPAYSERADFMMIGNFRHAPNQDAILWTIREIWPLIRRVLPNARLNIYGAYPPREMMQLTTAREGIFVLGPIEDQFEALARHRVNLAPLRFGAGIKGKVSDGWWAGTPVVTTSIGAEGMSDGQPFGGAIENSAQQFAEAAIRLFTHEDEWTECQRRGFELIRILYNDLENHNQLVQYLSWVRVNQSLLRRRNWIELALNYHSIRSSKYFSKWIELKSKGSGN